MRDFYTAHWKRIAIILSLICPIIALSLWLKDPVAASWMIPLLCWYPAFVFGNHAYFSRQIDILDEEYRKMSDELRKKLAQYLGVWG